MIPDSLSAMANHLWQSSLFAGAAGLLTLALRKNSARVRHWVWVAASFKFLIPFSVLIAIGGQIGWRTGSAIASANVPVVMEQFSQPFTITTVSSPILTTAMPAPNWLPAILWIVWACGFIGISISWWIRWRRIRAAVSAGSTLHLGLSIRAISSPSFLEPGIFGVFRPVLLVPEGIFENLTPEQWKTIVAHELCHVRRRDNLVGIIQMFVETVFWFHPLVWWVGQRIFQERELSCDEEVLRLGSEPRTYAQGILKVCELYLESPVACVAGIAGGANLRKRIELIVTNDVIRKLNLTKTVVLTVAGIASLAVPVVVGVMNAPLLMGQALPTSVDAGSTSRMEFEVAAIKPAGPMNLPRGGRGISVRGGIPGRCRQMFTLDPGRLDIRCYSLGGLMWTWAFRLPPARLVGTAWMGDPATDWSGGERFDISAKLPEGASRDQVPAMLQNLLAARFKLATHREYREQLVYALVAAKGGPKLQPASQSSDSLNAAANPQFGEPSNMNGVYFYSENVPDPGGSRIVIMNSPRMGTVRNIESGSPKYINRFEAPGITFGGLADLLTIAGVVDPEPVIDLTGEKGRYQVVLEMSMAELQALSSSGSRDDLPGASLKAAQDGLKKLGLQLEHRKVPIEVLVVDHLEKAPTEN
jgi:bla regulator protein BlaR1